MDKKRISILTAFIFTFSLIGANPLGWAYGDYSTDVNTDPPIDLPPLAIIPEFSDVARSCDDWSEMTAGQSYTTSCYDDGTDLHRNFSYTWNIYYESGAWRKPDLSDFKHTGYVRRASSRSHGCTHASVTFDESFFHKQKLAYAISMLIFTATLI